MSHLSLADLEAYDPRAPQRAGERRFLCPLCGDAKPKDAAHRSLSLNATTGLWNCKRCGAKGLLKDFWEERAPENRSQRGQRALQRAFSVPRSAAPQTATPELAAAEETASEPAIPEWRRLWDVTVEIGGTPGEAYLAGRGLDLTVASVADVRYTPRWHGRATLVFPIRNVAGDIVAISGRCLQNGGIDKPGLGPKKLGAFFAPAGRFTPLQEGLPGILLCEAPLDALSLAAAGFPALAFAGTAPPEWLTRACAFRRTWLAFDADDAGDAAAEKIGARLLALGSRCGRLRPEGAKDWNEALRQWGAAELGDWLAARVLAG